MELRYELRHQAILSSQRFYQDAKVLEICRGAKDIEKMVTVERAFGHKMKGE